MGTKKIGIACQGGGTHAAFTWGVLTQILETQKSWDAAPADGTGFDIVAISGTSAGALCALAVWYGLVPNIADPTCGSVDKAIERLNFLWSTFGATNGIEQLHNNVVATLLTLKSRGMPFPGSSPYGMLAPLGLAGLAMMGARQEYLGFPGLLEALCPDFSSIDWRGVAAAERRVMAGAIEMLSGNFEVFDSDKTLEDLGLHPNGLKIEQYNQTRWRMRRPISLEGVAASGTLPEILPAQLIANMSFPTKQPGRTVTRTGHYWDGLYSQNPPVRDFLDADDAASKPDEIWVIRINPQEQYGYGATKSLEDIKDRENALAGNLALNQELDHICTVNRWIAAHGCEHPPLKGRKIVTIRTIKMTRDTAWGLKYTSKFDRDPAHLNRLHDEGRAVAAQWLADWRALGSDFASYPADARYPEDI
ncbi:MAG: patatin-like phospholipase family protein [Rhodospirillales bacterium]|nr:patatin-like phospholipase family protein [Rhodospirillales bacterium]